MLWPFPVCLYFIYSGSLCVAEKISYISTERPAVTYFNPKYMTLANMSSYRYGRDDPFYYVELNMHWIWEFHNNVTVDFFFYEWLTNRYKPGFIEMHWKMCDLIHKDKFFGTALKQGMFDQPCPFPPGAYNLYNMTIPVKHIPPHFPFQKGRIYANLTGTDTRELVAAGHIDMEIKEINSRRKKVKKNII